MSGLEHLTVTLLMRGNRDQDQTYLSTGTLPIIANCAQVLSNINTCVRVLSNTNTCVRVLTNINTCVRVLSNINTCVRVLYPITITVYRYCIQNWTIINHVQFQGREHAWPILRGVWDWHTERAVQLQSASAPGGSKLYLERLSAILPLLGTGLDPWTLVFFACFSRLKHQVPSP